MSSIASSPPAPSWKRSLIALGAFMLVVFAVSAIGGLASQPGSNPWYQGLTLPSFQPPGWLFGVVWPVLYVMIAIAGWRVWHVAGGIGPARTALSLWLAQLVLNLAWTWIFFQAQNILGGLIDIALLWLVLAATMVAFFRHDLWAGLLLVPYLVWVSFATALNFAILQLNPGA